MRVLLVCLNAKYIHASPAPYALLSGIRAFGLRVTDAEILEGTVNQEPSEILSAILDASPDFIGFSCYIWNIGIVLSLAESVRARLPDCRICLGGPEVSSRERELLSANGCVDLVLSGEGEMSLPALLDALDGGDDLDRVPSLFYRRQAEIRESCGIMPVRQHPSPLSVGYAERLGGRMAYYESSRGCPFHCTFCLSGGRGGVRFFDIETAISELCALASSGTRTVKLVDRTFNADPTRAKRIWSALIDGVGTRFPVGVTFHFEIDARLLDEASIDLIARAPIGLFRFEIGLQSTNAKTLSEIGRSMDFEITLANVRRLVSLGCATVHLDLIAGLPHETLQSYLHGFGLAYAAKPHMLQLGFLKLLHGTALRDSADCLGIVYSTEPPYEVISTPTLSREELLLLHRFEEAFDRLYNSGRHRRTLCYITEVLGVAPEVLFLRVGDSLADSPASGLDALTERLLDLFVPSLGAHREGLIDAMLTDRLATNPNRRLPPSLVRFDRRIARLRAAVGAGERKNFALLSDGRILEATVSEPRHPVSGEYPIRILTEGVHT